MYFGRKNGGWVDRAIERCSRRIRKALKRELRKLKKKKKKYIYIYVSRDEKAALSWEERQSKIQT